MASTGATAATLSCSSSDSVNDDKDCSGDDKDDRHRCHSAHYRRSVHVTQKPTGNDDGVVCLGSRMSTASTSSSAEKEIEFTCRAVEEKSAVHRNTDTLSGRERSEGGHGAESQADAPHHTSDSQGSESETSVSSLAFKVRGDDTCPAHSCPSPSLVDAMGNLHSDVHARDASRGGSVANPAGPAVYSAQRQHRQQNVTAGPTRAVSVLQEAREGEREVRTAPCTTDKEDDGSRSSGAVQPTPTPFTPSSHSLRSPTPLDLTGPPKPPRRCTTHSHSLEGDGEAASDKAGVRWGSSTAVTSTVSPQRHPQRRASVSPPLVTPLPYHIKNTESIMEPASERRLQLSGSADERSPSLGVEEAAGEARSAQTCATSSSRRFSPSPPPPPSPPLAAALTRRTSPARPPDATAFAAPPARVHRSSSSSSSSNSSLHRSPSPRPVSAHTERQPHVDHDGYALPHALTTPVGGEGRSRPLRVPRWRWEATESVDVFRRSSPTKLDRRVSGVNGTTPTTTTAAAAAAAYTQEVSSSHLSGSCFTPPLLATPSLATLPSVAAPVAAAAAPTSAWGNPCVPQIVPTHDSVFFPLGTDVVAPVMLHYATVGGWSTCAGGRDYFSHRRLRGGEVAGHTVRWLHTAQPRNAFVFLVTPVERREDAENAATTAAVNRKEKVDAHGVGASRLHPPGAWRRLRRALFGEAPWYRTSQPGRGPRSRIACDDTLPGASESDSESKLLAPSTSEVYDPALHLSRSFPVVMSASQDTYCGAGESGSGGGRSAHSIGSHSSSPRGDASLNESSASPWPAHRARLTRSVETPALPCSMSPQLVARQPSQSSASLYRSPTGISAEMADRPSLHPTPMAIGAAAAVDVKGESAAQRYPPRLATPSTATAPPFYLPPSSAVSHAAAGVSPPRRSVTPGEVQQRRQRLSASTHSNRFVFSPLTGTAVATSGASPVTPHNPRLRPRNGKHEGSVGPSASPPSPPPPPPPPSSLQGADGVEVIEVAHADVTAMDYAPRLTSHRLSLEATVVHTYFFPTLIDALNHYQCAAALPLMEEQWAAGMTSQIPRPQCDAVARRTGAHPQQQPYMSPPRRSSSARTTSPTTALPTREQSSASPVSLASALRSAGDGEYTRVASAPTRLSRVHSLPSLHAETAEEAPFVNDSVQTPVKLQRGTLLSPATSGSTPPAPPPPPPPPAMPSWVQSTDLSAPPTPSLCHASVGRPPAAPRLTSTHRDIVVSVYTADPVFNSVLREVLMPEPGTHPYTSSVAEQKRLLSMVEVGMPAWAIFYSSTGLPYRRLFRLVYSGMTNLWPLVSLAVGVYDLYKHLPQLKRFMARTLDPLSRWLERRFRLRFSVMATYLISVVLTIFSSLGTFVSQFYVVQLLSLPIVQLLFALVKLPFVLAFDAVVVAATTAFSTVSLLVQLVHLVVMAPVVFVMNIASLRETVSVVAPVAVQGTSLSVKWWRAWSEFWETVASPIKNAVRAWWESMLHVSTSAARRETSIRRWYTPKVERTAQVLGEAQYVVAINTQMWWTEMLQPGLRRLVVLAVTLVYLYWLFLGISEKVWDDFLLASRMRHPPTVVDARHQQQQQQQQQHEPSSVPQPGWEAGVGAVGGCVEDTTTPAAAVVHVLFHHSFEPLAAAAAGLTTSTATVITIAATPPPHRFVAQCGGASPALLYAPTSVIKMCDIAGTSTMTTTMIVTTSSRSAQAGKGPAAAAAATTFVTTITTSLPLPQASLVAMAAELLLPNAVLVVLQQVTHLLQDGVRTLEKLVSTRRARARAGRQTIVFDNASASLQCSAEREKGPNDAVCLNEDDDAKVAMAVMTTRGSAQAANSLVTIPHSFPVAVVRQRRYSPAARQRQREKVQRVALVVVDAVVVDAPEMMPSWATINFLKFGDARGQETMREIAVVVKQAELAAAVEARGGKD